MAKRVVLKAGKETAVAGGHPWIFSGAVASGLDGSIAGEVMKVYSHTGAFLAQAYFNPKSTIAGRVISYDEHANPITAIRTSMERAIELRRELDERQETNAYRVINGEGDFLPGLIMDLYNDTLVVQFNSLGMERLKKEVISIAEELLRPRHIYEKSTGQARSEEGLAVECGWLRGGQSNQQPGGEGQPKEISHVEVLENSIRYSVPVTHGQKTGSLPCAWANAIARLLLTYCCQVSSWTTEICEL